MAEGSSQHTIIDSHRLHDLLTQFENLESGWDTHEGSPTNQLAISTVRDLLSTLMIVPTNNGGIQIEAHGGGLDVELCIAPNGELEAFMVDRG